MSLLDEVREAPIERPPFRDREYALISVEARDALVELADAEVAYTDATNVVDEKVAMKRIDAALERLRR